MTEGEPPPPEARAEPKAAEASGALALENRRRIYEFIRRTPGAHLREIQRALLLPYGTAEYHLHALEDAELVRAAADGNLKRYFAADFAYGDRLVLGLLRKRPVRAVVVALLEKGELTHQDLAHAAGIKPPTLSYHLPRLEAAHVVAIRRDGRFTRVHLVDPKLMGRLLVAHARSFADSAVDRFLETWSGFEVPREDPQNDGAAGPAAKNAEPASPGGQEDGEKKKEEGGRSPPKVG